MRSFRVMYGSRQQVPVLIVTGPPIGTPNAVAGRKSLGLVAQLSPPKVAIGPAKRPRLTMSTVSLGLVGKRRLSLMSPRPSITKIVVKSGRPRRPAPVG